jgi:hypothetical protein
MFCDAGPMVTQQETQAAQILIGMDKSDAHDVDLPAPDVNEPLRHNANDSEPAHSFSHGPRETKSLQHLQSQSTLRPKPKYYYEPNGVPVFEPDYESFKDFFGFVTAIEKFGMKAGLVKIVPPKEWFDSFKLDIEKLEQFQIKPIRQKFTTGNGLPNGAYRQINYGAPDSYTGCII